jgi:hypothetical protein
MKRVLSAAMGALLATLLALSVTVFIGGFIGFPDDIDGHREQQRFLHEAGMLTSGPMAADDHDRIMHEARRLVERRNFKETPLTMVRSIVVHHAWLLGLLTFAVFLAFRLSLRATWGAGVVSVFLWLWAAPVTAVCYLSGYVAHAGVRAVRSYVGRTRG